MPWIPALAADALTRPRTLRLDGHAVLLVPTAAGPRACEAACPHEGYPLVQGSVNGDVLTCRWHNFKFNLCDGAALIGEENLEVYPLRIVDGQIEVDPSPGDPAALRARRRAGLDAALFDGEIGRAAREAGRLIELGVDPVALALHAVRYDARHAEWGTQHSLAVAVDLIAELPRFPGLDALIPLTQLFDLTARSNLRQPPRPRPDPIDPGPDLAAAGRRFVDAVEAEEAAVAEGLLRGALAAGHPPDVLLPWLIAAGTAHFLDFGHALIYLEKLPALLAAGGALPDAQAFFDEVLGALVFRFVVGTREDTLPPWAPWHRRVDAPIPDAAADLAALERALLDAPLEEAAAAFVAAQAGPPDALAEALVRAGAQALLRFDPAVELRDDVQDTWLGLSHRLTVAEAARGLLPRLDPREARRVLSFVAHFLHAARPALGPATPAPTPIAGHLDGLLGLLHARSGVEATALVLGAWEADRAGLEHALIDLAFADLMTEPIFVAHQLKTTRVAWNAALRLGDPLPLRALLAWLGAARRERGVRRRATEAIALLRQGRPPKVLAP